MFRDFNHKLIFRIVGGLLLFEGVFLLSAVLVAKIYKEEIISYFWITSAIAVSLGLLFYFIGRHASPMIGKREGSIIVTSIWLVFSFIGLLPYWLSGSIPSFTDAFFETMSGFTTTGASILNNIESLPNSLLYWRSLTQWIGGLGIIVISIALLPIFGFSTVQLFSAEATGPTKDKIHPKMSETAKRLLAIYIVLTVIETLLLVIAGMGWFDAVNHSFTTMATGGFSTKQANIGYWTSPAIQYIIIFFMFIAGVNFSLFYFMIKGKVNKIKENEELRFFFIITLVSTFLVGISIVDLSNIQSLQSLEVIFRESLFNVVSLMTTTGFVTIDYMLFKPVVWIILLIVMLIGASAGSTAGGMKLVRVLLAVKYAYYEFKRIIHPNAVFPVKYNGLIVRDEIITRVLAFIMLYIVLIIIGTIVLAFSGMGFMESISGMITCISDVGPGLGSIGPVTNFASIPDFSKWFLSFVMLIGRLEVFTVLIIFTPIFWKK
ncbi:Trk system potassium uptake protein TrkH [bioreactor metagenome]|jgi:trk system potassium uptake protein TrkH|uniref:Trk system potassium uptake protein TrkH n=1 Tax=bioreactor metagenome TaxID=1076179 RepID=A0A644W6X2_9ZZZZ|nr:TrkH family potassium uptake protein [Paludibacter sp.]